MALVGSGAGTIKLIASTALGAMTTSSKASSSKTPKFNHTPRTGSLANSGLLHNNSLSQEPESDEAGDIRNSLYVDYENNPIRRLMHESQTSDEINKVVHDFHLRQQRMVYDSW